MSDQQLCVDVYLLDEYVMQIRKFARHLRQPELAARVASLVRTRDQLAVAGAIHRSTATTEAERIAALEELADRDHREYVQQLDHDRAGI